MPELPEVETIRSELALQVVGRHFTRVIVNDSKPLQKITPEEFSSRLVGQQIIHLDRRGKYLIFRLSSGEALIIHLRMTGNLLLNPGENTRYSRLIFEFDDNNRLVFADRRRLGVVYLVADDKEIVGKLGTEPFGSEFTRGMLSRKLKGRQAPIKAVLLDQGIVAGLGNMYADEVLFVARIHPLKKAGDLTPVAIKRLYEAILAVLKAAIEKKGASVDTYIRPGGTTGTAHENFQVAHRRGERCPQCQTLIERLVVRNRGTYHCPRCQRM